VRVMRDTMHAIYENTRDSSHENRSSCESEKEIIAAGSVRGWWNIAKSSARSAAPRLDILGPSAAGVWRSARGTFYLGAGPGGTRR
jgi:hypothetical protein